MKKAWVLAGVVALMSACAVPSNTSGGNTTSMGAAGAAGLGYHGPVHRSPGQYGN